MSTTKKKNFLTRPQLFQVMTYLNQEDVKAKILGGQSDEDSVKEIKEKFGVEIRVTAFRDLRLQFNLLQRGRYNKSKSNDNDALLELINESKDEITRCARNITALMDRVTALENKFRLMGR